MQGTIATAFPTDARRWAAVLRRDRRAEGEFLYRVRTTGVYCRPTCASRLPKRENVAFFASSGEAERAGFRACKRCRPGDGLRPDPGAATIARACRLMDEAEAPPALGDLAAAVGLSPSHFHRLFKRTVGVTPKEYAAAQRAGRVREGLGRSPTVTRAIYDAGFNAGSRFYEGAGRELGMAPAAYKNGAAGIEIRYAVEPSSLGWLLVAATEHGVCAIELDAGPEPLLARLRARFPRATLRGDDPAFAAWVGLVSAFVEAPQRGLDLPLDVQGTAFQHRVWKALRELPPGTTATYAEVAERIGRPGGARAVAAACAANPIAVAIPCHRVVGGDGGLRGYRWGVERKRALLEREAAGAQANGG